MLTGDLSGTDECRTSDDLRFFKFSSCFRASPENATGEFLEAIERLLRLDAHPARGRTDRARGLTRRVTFDRAVRTKPLAFAADAGPLMGVESGAGRRGDA